MSTLLVIALSNVVMAAVLAVPAMLAGLWGRRPALTYSLWLLVLLKLVTPPLFEIPLPWPAASASVVQRPPESVALPSLEADAAPPIEPIVPEPDESRRAIDGLLPEAQPGPIVLAPVLAGSVPASAEPEPPVPSPAPAAVDESAVAWIDWVALPWLAGSAAWLVVAGRRLKRFRRLLRFARRAPDDVQTEARALAAALRVPCPHVLLLPGAISPMLWVAGKSPRLLLPEGLLSRLGPGQLATVLAHELAHWRRGDHWLRWLEMLALTLYWWCPLAWWARRELHQAEEECCDAWVIELLPDSARAYALALVETIDYLSGAPASLPFAASGVGHVRLLKRRLTMILRGTTSRSLTRAGLACVAGFGLLLLPFVPGLGQTPDKPGARGPGDIEELQRLLRDVAAQTDKKALDETVAALERAQADLRDHVLRQQDLERVQRDLQAKREALEKKLKDIQRAIEHLRAQGERGADDRAQVGPGPGAATGGRWMGSGPASGQGGKPGSVEQRLEQVERKLDALLWEVTSLRREMGKHPEGPPAGLPNPGKGFFPGSGAPPGVRPGGTNSFPGGLGFPGGPTPGPQPESSPRNGFPGGDARPGGPGLSPLGKGPTPSVSPFGGDTRPGSSADGPTKGGTGSPGTAPSKDR